MEISAAWNKPFDQRPGGGLIMTNNKCDFKKYKTYTIIGVNILCFYFYKNGPTDVREKLNHGKQQNLHHLYTLEKFTVDLI